MRTRVVNLVAGPCAGKTVVSALLFAHLKKAGYLTEFAQEYAKDLVWQERFDELDNQYHVSTQQYRKFKSMVGKVEFIVTDGSLIHGLYYNRHNPTNVCDVDKTEKKILEYHNEFENIVIFVERGNFPFEQAGRQQNEAESKSIDTEIKNILLRHNISYITFRNGVDSLETLANLIVSNLEK